MQSVWHDTPAFVASPKIRRTADSLQVLMPVLFELAAWPKLSMGRRFVKNRDPNLGLSPHLQFSSASVADGQPGKVWRLDRSGPKLAVDGQVANLLRGPGGYERRLFPPMGLPAASGGIRACSLCLRACRVTATYYFVGSLDLTTLYHPHPILRRYSSYWGHYISFQYLALAARAFLGGIRALLCTASAR